MQQFQLVPFAMAKLPEINIAGEIERNESHITIHYEVSGVTDQIVFPAPSTRPSRKDDLWQATCFEFFLAIPDQSQYREFNMSPSLDWNVYIMDEYRRVGFREEKLIEQLQVNAQKEANGFVMNATVGLNPVFQKDQVLQTGITAIIKTTDGVESYWALAHPGRRADFHLRESFTVEL